MLNKFLLTGLLLTSSLATIANAMDVLDEPKLVIPAKKLGKGWKHEVFKHGKEVYYVEGNVDRKIFKMNENFTGVKDKDVFIFNQPGICNLTVKLISLIDSQQESSHPSLVQSLQNIHLTEPVEEKNIPFTSSKSSDFEVVKYEMGNLILSQDQMRKAMNTGELKTEHGTFSVTSLGFLNYYWKPEIYCHPTYNGFAFSHENAMNMLVYKKKLNPETKQWEDDYNQRAMFEQIFNSETGQSEDDLSRPIVNDRFTLTLTKLQDSQKESSKVEEKAIFPSPISHITQNLIEPPKTEEEKIPSTSSKSSKFEIVKYEFGNLILSQDQMRKAIETGILTTEHETFSVTSSGFLNYYWNPEISCHPIYNGFEFVVNQVPVYKKKLNSETMQWEDDFTQLAMFEQVFNPETSQWEDDLSRPIVNDRFTLTLTKLQD